MFVYKLPFTSIQLYNVLAQLGFNYLLIALSKSWYPFIYLIESSFLAGSLHPCAAHFIAEHYVFSRVDTGVKNNKTPHDPSIPLPETYSYYGPLNVLTYNVGLHNEHHDFPAVPWTRLPKLHNIAKEFYQDLPHHKSWIFVIWYFILDPQVGLWCRIKRKEGGRLVGGSTNAWKEEELGSNEKKGLKAEGVR